MVDMKSKLLHAIVWKEDKLYVAKFLELEIASQGKTKDEAMISLREALDLYLEDDAPSSLLIPIIDKVSTQTVSLN